MFRSLEIKKFRQFQNKKLLLGKYITVLAGRNATGKSTVLGLLANSSEIKKTVGETYSHKRFRAEFSEIIKGSKRFDETGTGLFQIAVEENDGKLINCDFRTTWQKYDKEDNQAERFRLIPKWKKDTVHTTEAKLEYPVIYLGLSRLFPVGESQGVDVKKQAIKFDEGHEEWFVEKYKRILSINEELESVTNYSIAETDKKTGVGVTTGYYDYLTNSSGQDNLGQILLSILSFKRLRDKVGGEWKGGLLLIDELDATLHPVAQNRLFALLTHEAKTLKLQVVFTTHSLSLLRSVTEITVHNSDKPNQNIELYYFTAANRKLEILRNPAYHTVEDDLMIQSSVQSHRTIKVYTEDAEARWFLKCLLGEYGMFVDMLDVRVGCQSLISMYKNDIEYFAQTLVILDGDVKKNTLNTIPITMQEKINNILLLPGGKRPEEVIYEYLLSLDGEHEFWDKAKCYNMTWQYFNDNGPKSNKYKRKKVRERYKAWFNEHEMVFDATRLGEYWMRDHKEEVELFLKSFKNAFNAVAKRTLTPEMEM